MINWIRKHWWVIVLFLTALPFGLNYVINIDCGFSVIGEPKDWLIFWGTYISSIASAVMVFLTYIIIKQNDEIRQGRVVCSLIFYNQFYLLQISNVGNSQAYDIEINSNEDFNMKLNKLSRIHFTKVQNRKFSLTPNESKHVSIECAIIGKHTTFNPETNSMEDNSLSSDYLQAIKQTPIKIKGTYWSIGKKFKIDYILCLNDFIDTPFLLVESTVNEEITKIRKAIENIKLT